MNELSKFVHDVATDNMNVWQAGFKAGKEAGRREAWAEINEDLKRLKALIGEEKDNG